MTFSLVSIGLTTFNAAQTVEQAVSSALAQEWRPIEIVVVDDCSSDETVLILDRLAAIHPELRVFSNAINGGVAVSRNRILAESKGEFIVFFDDDDESTPNRISMQLKRIIDYERDFADGSPVICHTARQVIYPDGSSRREPTMGQIVGGRAPAGIAVAHRILLGSHLQDGYGACPTCSQAARLSTYQLIGGFDPDFRRGEDTDFNIRLAQAGGHFVGIGQSLVIQNMTQSSEKSLAVEYKFMIMLMEKHRSIFERAGQFSFCLCWIKAKQAFLEGRRLAFGLKMAGLALTHPVLAARRIGLAFHNIGLNMRFGRFHRSQL